MHLRAASDVIAVHFAPDGKPRIPDAAAITDTQMLTAALVDLGQLAATILAAEEPLALRASKPASIGSRSSATYPVPVTSPTSHGLLPRTASNPNPTPGRI